MYQVGITTPILQMRNLKFRDMKCIGYSMLTAVGKQCPKLRNSQQERSLFLAGVTIQGGWGRSTEVLLHKVAQGPKLLPLDNLCLGGGGGKRQSTASPPHGFRGQETSLTPILQLHSPTYVSARKTWSLTVGWAEQGRPRYWWHCIFCNVSGMAEVT